MDKINTRTLTASIIFILINGLFLASHFTWWGCIPFAILILFYFLRTGHIRPDEKGKIKNLGITAWLGMYIGTSVICMGVIDAIASGFMPDNGFAAIKYLKTGNLVFLIIITVVAFFVGLGFATKDKQTFVWRIIRYALLFAASYFILQFTMKFSIKDLIPGMIGILWLALVIEY